ncbi:hypothetical protein V1291_002822 [Nitrobacteraceae bacterium AZCC 1564]
MVAHLATTTSAMGTSETLLTVVAIRLAALVVAGLVIKALPEQPHREPSCTSVTVSSAKQQKPRVPEDIETLQDMLLHD